MGFNGFNRLCDVRWFCGLAWCGTVRCTGNNGHDGVYMRRVLRWRRLACWMALLLWHCTIQGWRECAEHEEAKVDTKEHKEDNFAQSIVIHDSLHFLHNSCLSEVAKDNSARLKRRHQDDANTIPSAFIGDVEDNEWMCNGIKGSGDLTLQCFVVVARHSDKTRINQAFVEPGKESLDIFERRRMIEIKALIVPHGSNDDRRCGAPTIHVVLAHYYFAICTSACTRFSALHLHRALLRSQAGQGAGTM